MGAKAPSPHWIPEDDVLLKNAVEAGASLESLSKGAVQFSRRFTVQELQDRWFSLLYDPVISSEASSHMIEVERWGVTDQLRPNKLEGGKDVACNARKRKPGSIRKYYYSMRKRICNEPFDTKGINFASGPCYSKSGDGNGFSSAHYKSVNPALNNLGARGPDYDTRPHSFPEFVPHVAESTGKGVAPTFGDDLGQKNASDNLSYPYEDNTSLKGDCGDCTEIPGFIESKDLPLGHLFEDEDLVNQGSAYSEFGGQSFHNFGYPPPLSEIPIWRSSEAISESCLPIQNGDLPIREKSMIPPATYESDALCYGGGPSNPNLETLPSCDNMIDMNSSTQEYIDQLFDLSNDEGLLYMDNDGNEAIGKSYLEGLSSLLLESPNQPELPSSGLDESAVSVDGHLVDRSDLHIGELNNKDLSDQLEVADAEVTASGSTIKVGPEYHNGVIYCTLNTDDPEIPSNDDVFLPFRFPSPTKSSGAGWGLHDHSHLGSSSMKNLSTPCYASGGPLVPSGKMEASHLSDAGLWYQRDHGLKFELPESSVCHAALREARSSEYHDRVSLANVNANNFISGVKGGPMDMGQGKNIGYTSLNHCPESLESSLNIHTNLQRNSISSQNGVDGIAKIPNNGLSNAGLSFQQTDVPKATDQTLFLDQEELWSENEFDVACFSDVEAMILDMDLSPDEFDFCTNPEVQRYQHEETKRTIIRLEQGADAVTQRVIASQGVFAVLYGRYSKHFIKKPEVLLGRATDEFEVDINLGREKNGSKISRRQATIKMDRNGIFQLQNLGKTSVYMNGKEVVPGQSLGLVSGCLIEVRGLSFVFETNRKMIKQYVDSAAADDKP